MGVDHRVMQKGGDVGRRISRAVHRTTPAAFYHARPATEQPIPDKPVNPHARQADGERRMLKPAPPIPNVERQRKFRERNPGYYRKYYARKRSIRLAAVAQR